jgi:hypothetical protein
MKSSRTGIAILGVATIALAACQKTDDRKGTTLPKTETPAPKTSAVVNPEAVAALRNMSRYLTSLNTAELTSNGSIDVVTEDGQRIQMDGVTNYKLRKPGFVIDFKSDLKNRQFYYDGKTFTQYTPGTGFYASVPAPGTNREALAAMYKQYGISLPLEDLFRWADPAGRPDDQLKSAYQVGTATIDGVATDHYAFREGAADWELWIEQGDRPLPRKMVIVDRTDDARPTFTARLDWKINPPLSDSDFRFVPAASDKRIGLARFQETGE